MDPVSENVAAAMSRPVYVLPAQDHIAHIMTHIAFLKSPLFGANPVIAQTFMYPMAEHLKAHLLNYYLVESHNAIDRAQREDVIKPEAKEQVNLILEVQQFIEQQMGPFGQELTAINEAAQQYKPQPPMPPDNTMQIAQMNAQIKGQEMQQRAAMDQARIQLDQQKLQLGMQSESAKLAERQQERVEGMQVEQFKQQNENQRTAEELAARERMNSADNQTAMRLAAAEIAYGDKVAVSTGTGINPNP
jgi:hypothetical protein